MADFALTIGTLALLVASALLGWRRLAGRPRTPLRAAGRLALVLALALPAVGVVTYRLTKSRAFQLSGDLVRRVETAEKVIALTFDDGPTPGYTEDVLGLLAQRGIKATFYLTGADAEANGRELRAIIAAGHELGNHTYSHRRMYFLPGAEVAREIDRTDGIFEAAGYAGAATFRPPGCKRLLTAPLYLAEHGRTTVTWDLEPDSIPGIAEDADAIVESVMEGARPGSIVLMHVMHESRGPSREALPRILDGLKGRGYRFVTVSELLALQGS